MHGLLEALKTGTVDTVNEERKILGMRNVSSDSLALEAHFMSQGRCDGGGRRGGGLFGTVPQLLVARGNRSCCLVKTPISSLPANVDCLF